MAVVRMLYIVEDEEGEEIIELLKCNKIDCRIFICSENERKMYDCPSLLTTEGHFKGKEGIEYYIQNRQFLESLRPKDKCLMDRLI